MTSMYIVFWSSIFFTASAFRRFPSIRCRSSIVVQAKHYDNHIEKFKNTTRRVRKSDDGEMDIQEYLEQLIHQWARRDNATKSHPAKNVVELNVYPPPLEIYVNTLPAGDITTPYDIPPATDDNEDEDDETYTSYRRSRAYQPYINAASTASATKKRKSDNFEVLSSSTTSFRDVGGYANVKMELMQCVDLLQNYTKYARFNVRVPKGLILEGPPGNGKTLLAKAFAGECGTGFLPVSGSQFQDKYVGVGASRVRELFELARQNIPCVVFIDEIDALGRVRSDSGGAGEGSNAERDSTLNELLVALDGFHNTSGIFVIGSTNRPDMLDPALLRPGRIDKRIYLALPDEPTRRAILEIHIRGKPHDNTVVMEDLVGVTEGLSAAQIENVLNEAMLYALRTDREIFTSKDIDLALGRTWVGWQPNEHRYTNETIHQICIHEMGHALLGMVAKHHAKMKKAVINLSSPNSPGYTVFESTSNTLQSRQGLMEHLMILIGGHVAEEIVFGKDHVSTGAISDFEEALKLAEKMVLVYGMGRTKVTPVNSEKYKSLVDDSVQLLLQESAEKAYKILIELKTVMMDGAHVLFHEKVLTAASLADMLKDGAWLHI